MILLFIRYKNNSGILHNLIRRIRNLYKGGGVYNLIIKLSRDKEIKIGRLGVFVFPRGFYVYTGSAQNGLERRINRHLSGSKKFHWHIDYLLSCAEVIKVIRYNGDKNDECRLNHATGRGDGATPVVKKFGSSDCNCVTHLYYFRNIPRHLLGQAPALTE